MVAKKLPVKKQFVSVGNVGAIEPNTLSAGVAAGNDVLIISDSKSNICAASNKCPHIGTPLD